MINSQIWGFRILGQTLCGFDKLNHVLLHKEHVLPLPLDDFCDDARVGMREGKQLFQSAAGINHTVCCECHSLLPEPVFCGVDIIDQIGHVVEAVAVFGHPFCDDVVGIQTLVDKNVETRTGQAENSGDGPSSAEIQRHFLDDSKTQEGRVKIDDRPDIGHTKGNMIQMFDVHNGSDPILMSLLINSQSLPTSLKA